jgi:Cdc6-like AAA superfamily ATPase
MADLIKILADQAIDVTLCLVGVADDVSDLIGEHASIERNLEQVKMPRMSADELADIVTTRINSLKMSIDTKAARSIVHLSQGLPHYTHLLGQSAAIVAVNGDHKNVTYEHANEGMSDALNAVQQSILEKYQEAIASSQKNMYPEVILACALAHRDEQDYFTQPDVREPLSNILGRAIDIPSYARHLSELCTERRGALLVRKGQPRRYRYRLANPLMGPYVIMRGMSEGRIDHDLGDLH